MKITVEFANLDEFKQYMGIESPSLLAQASKETEGTPAPAEAVQEPQEAPEAPAPKKNAIASFKMFHQAIRKSFYADVIKHFRVKPNRETVNFIEQFFRDKN